MTDEEYLMACGWSAAWWTGAARWVKRAEGSHVAGPLSLAEAVAAQIAEDRARFAFVMERTLPKAEHRSIDPGFFVDVATLSAKGQK